VTGQGASVTQTAGTYASSNAETNDTVTAALGSANFTASSGTLLSNYTIPTIASGVGTITQRALTASIIGNPTKIYNGTNGATLSAANFSVSGFVIGQGANVTQTAGTYASSNVGTNDLVTASLSGANFTALTNTLLSNYVLPTSASGAGTILSITNIGQETGTSALVIDFGRIVPPNNLPEALNPFEPIPASAIVGKVNPFSDITGVANLFSVISGGVNAPGAVLFNGPDARAHRSKASAP